MTEYDLRTRRALRQVTLLEYSFGPGTKTRRTTNSFYEGGNDLCNEQKANS